jgi:hypothetical protein
LQFPKTQPSALLGFYIRYLREAIEKRGGLEKTQSLEELRQAVIEGAVHRLRPKLLTEGVAILAIRWCSPKELAAKSLRQWHCPYWAVL